jgi:hypothetical protein
VLFKIKRDSSLLKLIHKYAEHAGVNVSALRFFFEGNSIVEIHTPNELEMEDGDVIDAAIKAVSTHTGSTSSILCEASSQEQEQEGEQEPPLASAAACVILQPTDTTKASGAASQPVDEVSEPQATEEQLAAGQQLQQQQWQAQQQQQRLLQQQQRQQRQQAASSGLRAGKCPALDVRVEWVVAQTPQWRGVVRAKLDQLMEQKRQHEAARLREEQAMQQRQREAQFRQEQLWRQEQQERAEAEAARQQKLLAEQQRQLSAFREEQRQQFMQIQDKLTAQAREAQQRIAAQKPMQNSVERKRGITAAMETYSKHVSVKRRRGSPLPAAAESNAEPDKPAWAAEELQLLQQLAASGTSRDWSAIAARLPGRTAERCCERWAESFAPTLKLVACPAPGLSPLRSGADDEDNVADDEAAVNECRTIIQDLTPRWRDAISFMLPADAREVDTMWQVYHKRRPAVRSETEDEDEEEEEEQEQEEEEEEPKQPADAHANQRQDTGVGGEESAASVPPGDIAATDVNPEIDAAAERSK